MLASSDSKISYLINFCSDDKNADLIANKSVDLKEIDDDIRKQDKLERERLLTLNIKFGNFEGIKVNNNVFNKFIKNIQKQTDMCAFGKNYVGDMLGVRDVYQQIETALVWDKTTAREKIIFALGHTMDTGRSPRQFSVPQTEGEMPRFDMREFVDQGLWIINAVYKYLAYTNDFTILNEKCSYYYIDDENMPEKNLTL